MTHTVTFQAFILKRSPLSMFPVCFSPGGWQLVDGVRLKQNCKLPWDSWDVGNDAFRPCWLNIHKQRYTICNVAAVNRREKLSAFTARSLRQRKVVRTDAKRLITDVASEAKKIIWREKYFSVWFSAQCISRTQLLKIIWGSTWVKTIRPKQIKFILIYYTSGSLFHCYCHYLFLLWRHCSPRTAEMW